MATDVTAPVPPAPRRMGWSPLPMLCLHCKAKLRPNVGFFTFGSVRCSKCEELHAVVLVQQLHMVYLAEITVDEAVSLAARGLTAFEVLKYLGAATRAA